MRILLADDHHLVREAIASYLTRAVPGIICVKAADFQQVRSGWETAARNRSDAVRIAMLQGMSGL